MKNLLIATTALVATAGVASAEITLSGFGRVGATYLENRFNDTNSNNIQDAGEVNEKQTQVEHRMRIVITGEAEAEFGVTFSAQTRIQADDAATTAQDTFQSTSGALYAPAYRIGYQGLSLAVGNVSLVEETAGYAAGSLGYTGFMYANPRAFNGDANYGNWTATTDGVIMLTYANAGFKVGVSTSDTAAGVQRNVASASYSAAGYTVAVTAQDSDNNDQDFVSLHVGGKVEQIGFAIYADNYKNGTNGFGASVSMSVAEGLNVALTANTVDNSVGVQKDELFGVGFNYDLGAGVSLGGGVASMRGSNYAEMGVVFNF
ncbi:porin [Seohaeicola sp.]|uniref:porin n=1 Tax=Seohaeicola sp. TaxID=2042026 RepID=UPI003A8BEF71